MKWSERICGNLYKTYLGARCSRVTWAREDDPPDFVFHCDGVRHAVEVTELHQYLDVQGEEESRTKWDEAVADICERCQKELGPTLDRTIVVVISSPLTDGDLKSLRPCILSYARSGNREEETLFDRDDCYLKSHADDEPITTSLVIPSGESLIPGSQTLSSAIQARTDYALDRILSAKLRRLEGLRDFQERVLILYSTDPFCKVRHVQSSLCKYEQRHNTVVRRILTRLFLASDLSLEVVFSERVDDAVHDASAFDGPPG